MVANKYVEDIIALIKTNLEAKLPPAIVAQKKAIVANHGADRDWLPLADGTKRRKKGNDQPWVESGATIQSLKVAYKDTGNTLAFYVDTDALPNKDAAMQVDQGAQPGTGRFTADIPARPLFNFTAPDVQAIRALVYQIVKETVSGYNG